MYFKFSILLLNYLLLQYCVILVWSKNIPSYFHICKNDNQLNKCFINSVRDLLPYLAKGIPELNLPPIEPLHISNISTTIGGTSVKLDAELLNGITHGLKDLVLTKTEIHPGTGRFTVECHLPAFNIQGNYKLTGKILLFEIAGKGSVTINAKDVDCTLIWSGKFYTKDGNKHLKLDNIEVSALNIKKFEINLENLFEGNEVLTRSVNEAINENMDSILSDLGPILKNEIADAILDYSNRILVLFSMDQLFSSA